MFGGVTKLVGFLAILMATDTFLDGNLPLYMQLKPHGPCNGFKRSFWQGRWCVEAPSELALPRPEELDTLSTLSNLSKAIVVVDERLRDHSLLLRQSARMLSGEDETTLKAIVEQSSVDLGQFRVVFDGVYDTIVGSMEKVRLEIKATNTSLMGLQKAFVENDETTWQYHIAKFERTLNTILSTVQPIPDLLSKTRKEAGFEQQKLVDVVALTELQKEKYWFHEMRTHLGFLKTLNVVVSNADSSIKTLKHAESRLRNSYSRWKNTRDELREFFEINAAEYFERMRLYPALKETFQEELDAFVEHVQSELDFMVSP